MKKLRARLEEARERLWNRIHRRHDAAPGSPQRAYLAQQVRKARGHKDDLIEKIKRLAAQRRLRWPRNIKVAELLYHSPPHCHFASPERDKLIRIGKIAERRYGLVVTEHPYFDGRVECVHVSGSWHYRDSSAPYVARSCANQGDGLAMDINGTREVEFYNELKRRYG